MPLNKNTLKAGIKAIMTDMLSREENSIDEFAERLSTEIDNYIKSATIVYTAGLATPPGGGAVSGTFQGEIK